MKTIFISAGHSNVEGQDRGAFGNGKWEGDLTVEFRDLLISEFRLLGINPITDVNKNALSQTLAYFKAITNKDSLLIDIHLNASADKNAHGTEVYVPDDASNFEKKVAEQLAEIMSDSMKTRNRGVFPESSSNHQKLGWMRLIGENVLLEICFISNFSDFFSYDVSKEKMAKRLAVYLSSLIEKEVKPPSLLKSIIKPKFMPV